MKRTIFVSALTLLGGLFSSYSYAQTYTYDLQVEEIQALMSTSGGSATLIPVDQERPTKKYACELTITVAPSDKTLSGSWGDGYGKNVEWYLTANKLISSRIKCPGNDLTSRIVLGEDYYRGIYNEHTYYNGKEVGQPVQESQSCTRNDRVTVALSTPNNGERLIRWSCPVDIDINEVAFTGMTTANFVISKIPQYSTNGKTPTLFKLKNGKISGYSDELLFSGTYQLK